MSINFSDVGRIGKDAVTRYTGNGEPVTGFSLAVDSGYGDKKQTIWLDCSAWGKRYEGVSQYLIKGAQVLVQGELGTREHEGKTYLTVRVADIKLVGGKQASDSQERPQQRQAPRRQREQSYGDAGTGGLEDDSIPFAPFRPHSYY
ncbi:single-stranded DNA-binding protein [Luteibacter sp. SG786]|uniref:single-stranded DNA-binding protein n=1 Tax=Luteibacter sp. SG786 TaxID=2587130 RepID=UPI0014228568|nr:single-stranded DNA-binding protein [Luteibacter sp. SG786]NII54360.1 single-strand DNA-binding protein [Luteibacter sp. SG786]